MAVLPVRLGISDLSMGAPCGSRSDTLPRLDGMAGAPRGRYGYALAGHALRCAPGGAFDGALYIECLCLKIYVSQSATQPS